MRANSQGVAVDIAVLPGHALLDGHFPATGILPAVGQVHWVITIAQKFLGAGGSGISLHFLKFNRLILPGSDVQLVLQRAPEAGAVRFRMLQAGSECSSGEIRFEHG